MKKKMYIAFRDTSFLQNLRYLIPLQGMSEVFFFFERAWYWSGLLIVHGGAFAKDSQPGGGVLSITTRSIGIFFVSRKMGLYTEGLVSWSLRQG